MEQSKACQEREALWRQGATGWGPCETAPAQPGPLPGCDLLVVGPCMHTQGATELGQDRAAYSQLCATAFEPVFLGLQSLGRGSAEGSVGLGPPQAGLQSAGAFLSSCAP